MSDAGWRTNPQIQEAKRVAQALGTTAVVLVILDDLAETVGIATYGIDGPRCTNAGKLGDALYREALAVWNPPRRVVRSAQRPLL